MEWEKLRAFLQSLILETNWPQRPVLERTYSRDLVAGACQAKAVVMPRNVSCGTSLSSFWVASLFVPRRAGWLGNEQLCHHLPKPQFQVTLSTAGMKIAVWETRVAAGKRFASHQVGAHQYNSFNCNFGCTFYMSTGKTLGALTVARPRPAHLPFTPYVYQKEVAMSCSHSLLSKRSF